MLAPPIKVDPEAEPYLKGRLKKIQSVVLDFILEEARKHSLPVKGVQISLVLDPEEDWWEIALDVTVNAPQEDAMAFWEAVEKRIEAWAQTQPETVQKTLASHIAVSVEWPVRENSV